MDAIRAARAGAVICIVGAAGAVVIALALLAGFEPADESPRSANARAGSGLVEAPSTDEQGRTSIAAVAGVTSSRLA